MSWSLCDRRTVWLHVLGRIQSKARESDAQERRPEIGDALPAFATAQVATARVIPEPAADSLDVGHLRIEVRKPRKPAGVEVQRVRPRVEGALAVEVQRAVWDGWKLLRGGQPRV